MGSVGDERREDGGLCGPLTVEHAVKDWPRLPETVIHEGPASPAPDEGERSLQSWKGLRREEQEKLAAAGITCDPCMTEQQLRQREPASFAVMRQHEAINKMVAERIYNDMMSK